MLATFAIGALLLKPDNPPDRYGTVAVVVLVLGLAIVLISLFGLIHVGVENMGWELQWPLRWPFRQEEMPISQPSSSREMAGRTTGRTIAIDAKGSPQGGVSDIFDPRMVITDVQSVDLSGLDKPESYAVFGFVVRNLSGFPIEVTGATGAIYCSGERCLGPLSLDQTAVRFPPSSHDRHQCSFTLPLSDSMMQHIVMQHVIMGEGILRWQLSGLTWVGTAELPSGRIPLKDCHFGAVDIVVRGPIPRRGPSPLFRFPIIFASGEEYDGNGSPKPPAAQE